MQVVILDLLNVTESEVAIFIAYAAMVVMALVPIYYGAYRSLDQDLMESMTAKDAWMFPIVGSCVLFGLYVLFKVLELVDYVNLLLTTYFLLFGILAVTTSVEPIIKPFFPKSMQNAKPSKIRFSVPFVSDPIKIKWTTIDIFALIVASGVGIAYVFTKHWITNNILGLAFSIQGVSMISLGSYKVGCILLGGLFFYDIFWVFGTEVMVTVATNFDAPVKLLFPKDIFASEYSFSMLGLGDIVIPGIFVALMLRFDYARNGKQKPFETPYFSFTFVAYMLGLITTIFVMHVFKAAQPALLYLVPYCIVGSLACAFLLGELPKLILFDEEVGGKRKRKKKKQK